MAKPFLAESSARYLKTGEIAAGSRRMPFLEGH
jgi:hypothetical protein